MKKVLIAFGIIAFLGCNKNDYISLSDSDPSVVMFTTNAAPAFPRISYTPDGSLTDEYLSFDDVAIKAKFSGPTTAPADITITYSIDAGALAKYNTDQAAANPSYKPFALLPDSTFSLLVTTDVIKKGEVYAPKVLDNVVTHPQKIDPSKNYMIPISVKTTAYGSAKGSGTIFYAIIGNPLAGAYNVEGYFYHPSLPRPFTRTGASGALVPVSETALVTELGDLGSSGYYAVLSVPDPYATTVQHVTVSVYPGSISPVFQWDTGLPTGYTPAPAPDWGKSALCNNTYDPATKTFYLRYGYNPTANRVTEEIIKKQ